jgi:hypothetical protein
MIDNENNRKQAIAWLETLPTRRILAFRRAHQGELYGGGYIEVYLADILYLDREMFSHVLDKREHVDR